LPLAAGQDNYPTLADLVEAASSAEIVHVTCHGGVQEDNTYYWTLDHEHTQTFKYRINSDFPKTTEWNKHPLVFGNACASVATCADSSARHGFGSAFMIAGALNFVGTFAPITKTMAVEFGMRFYQRLLGESMPIAEALLAAKRSFKDDHFEDPSYLFYCLYGPPDAIYTLE
jgi:CHAT domain-containing protein